MNRYLDYVKSQEGWPVPSVLELRSREWIKAYNARIPSESSRFGAIGIPQSLAVGKSLEECQAFYDTSLFPNAQMTWVMFETRPLESGESRFPSPQIVPDFILGRMLDRIEDFYGGFNNWQHHLDLRSLHYLLKQTGELLHLANIESKHRVVGEWVSRSLPEFIRGDCYRYGKIARDFFLQLLEEECD